jgi:hypothetical protein
MAKSDDLPELILDKTQSGRLKWDRFMCIVGESRLSLFEDELGQPGLTIYEKQGSLDFRGITINELFVEVVQQSFANESDLLEKLKNMR